MRPRRAVWWLLLAAGVTACAATLALPWRSEDFHLGLAVRVTVAAAGATLLLLVARTASRAAPVVATGVLGAGVLAYPSLLSTAAAEVGGPVMAQLGAAGHVLPLTLVQLLPVLTSRHVLERSHLRWEVLVVTLALAGVVLVGLGLSGAPGASRLLALSTVLWFGSFLIAPVVTWSAVRGTSGETRLRAVVAALAALVPVVVITWCLTLGLLTSRLGTDVAVSALMLGFAGGTLACGVLALGALAPHGSGVLRTGVVIAALHGLLAALALIAGTVTALTTSALGVPTGGAVVVGATVTVLAGLPWLRLHAWIRRVVDPAAELRHELMSIGPVPEGQRRQAILHALRRVTGDPALEVAYAVAEQTWFGSAGEAVVGAQTNLHRDWTPVVRREDGTGAVLARATTPASAQRLRALGDCSDTLSAALLEAQVAHGACLADAAAQRERDRLQQDLHDGLQSRLLGLALKLQLGARTLGDPASALLAQEAVGSLRAAVDDVRSLGGGRLPEVLARDGLGPALSALFRPVDFLVELDVAQERLGADAEAATYFVVGEAVSNALKHAAARRIQVEVALREPGRVAVTVRDDGRGGADPRMGSGLRGLAERVAAAGGVFVVRDEEQGTTVEAVLPCAS